ncbi:methylated-DNA--[protein]-cysteine S-methyltransferase [Comamonadaceae bacterium M7527]|nr:methylated-DNA--[protein]-cysteine S-methyltransferase [Comamonadaceae bacterium M7527]
MLAAVCNEGLSGLWFEQQKHTPDLSQVPQDDGQHKALWRDVAAQLNAYALGDLQRFDLPLHLATGSAFAQRVWQALLQVPFGVTTTYGQLAAQLGSAPRAVGAAVGRNPISIIVPCHRVVGTSGALTGYAGGLHNKTALLRLEHYFD